VIRWRCLDHGPERERERESGIKNGLKNLRGADAPLDGGKNSDSPRRINSARLFVSFVFERREREREREHNASRATNR